MRRFATQRTQAIGLSCLMLITAGIGCDGSSKPRAKSAATPKEAVNKVQTDVPEVPAAKTDTDPSVIFLRPGLLNQSEQALKQFITNCQAQKWDAQQLSVSLKKLIAPAATVSDKALGYSDWAAEQWLKDMASKINPTGKRLTTLLNENSVGCEMSPPEGPNASGVMTRTLIKLVKSGDQWLIDWMYCGLPTGPSVDSLPLGGREARFTVAAFLTASLAGDANLMEPWLSDAFRAQIAPPLPGDTGYNRGTLKIKLRNMKGDANGITTLGFTTKDTRSEYLGEWLTPEKKRPLSMRLVLSPDGWKIDAIETLD